MYIAYVQTDPDPVYRECEQLKQKLQKCKKDLQNARLNADMIRDSDEKTKNKRPMGHIAHLRKQFKSINTYDYIITLIKRRKITLLTL